MKTTRVLVLLHELSETGSPRLTIDLLDGMDESASFRIVSWAGGPLVANARSIGPTTILRMDVRGGRNSGPLANPNVAAVVGGASARVRGLGSAASLRRWGPDLVYVSSVWSLPLIRRLRLSGVPILLQVHEMGSALASFEKTNPGMLVGLPDRYVAVSQAVADDLVAMGVRPDLVSVVPPYSLVPVRPEPGAVARAAGACVVGGAGNPSWTKGIDLWLLAAREAVDRLGPGRLRFSWLWCRDNEEGLRLRAMVARLGLGDVVDLPPRADDPGDWFRGLDLFATTSWEDSAPLVVLEAMSCGVPVLCFGPSGGAAESVGDAGVVLQRISPHDMAEAIVRLAEDPDRRAALGRAALERVRSRPSRSDTQAAMRELMARTRTAPRA